jgi:hypothetical protein
MPTIDQQTLDRIANLSTPHMKALNEAITAAYPDNPDAMYAVAFALQFSAMIYAMSPEARSVIVGLTNMILEKSRTGYKLVPLA